MPSLRALEVVLSGFAYSTPYGAERAHSYRDPRPYYLRHPIASLSPHDQCRNINLLSIDYAFRPRLRCRLTLLRLTLNRKP